MDWLKVLETNCFQKMQKMRPYSFITASTIEQAIERAGTKHGNLGWSAALSALDMASVLSLIDEASN